MAFRLTIINKRGNTMEPLYLIVGLGVLLIAAVFTYFTGNGDKNGTL